MDQRGYIITKNTSSTTPIRFTVALQDGRVFEALLVGSDS